MEEILKNIIPHFTNHGLLGVLSLLLLGLTYTLIKSDWFGREFSKLSDIIVSYFMKRKSSKSGIRVITESDISNHDIFSYIDFWIYSKIPTFQFSTEYRTVVFRRYLVVFLKKYKENIVKNINSKDFGEMDSSQIWKCFLSLQNDVVHDYEKEMILQGIPKIIIDKMKVKNNDTISLTIDLIEGICNSQFYESDKNLLKVYSILNILLSVLENTISSSEVVCNSINGQLKGLKITDGLREYIEP